MSKSIVGFVFYILYVVNNIVNNCSAQPVVKPVLRLDDNEVFNDNPFSYVPYKTLYEPHYLIIGSSHVRPGQVYRIVVNLLYCPFPLNITASIISNDEEIASSSLNILPQDSQLMLMQIPFNARIGKYQLKIAGSGEKGGKEFVANSNLKFSPDFLTILIQTNQLVYNMNQEIKIRVILLNMELKPYVDAVDIRLLDSRDLLIKRWNSIYPFQGFIEVSFQLPGDYPKGWWKVKVQALKQVEEKSILLERWFFDRFDVNVILPAYIDSDEPYIEGTITANHTNLLPVSGNVTIYVILMPENVRIDFKQLNGDFTNFTKNMFDIRNYAIRTDIIKQFEGSHTFHYNMRELMSLSNSMQFLGRELMIYAEVGEQFFDYIVTGYARTRIVRSKIMLRFLDTEPAIFKKGMPFEAHIAVSYTDFVPLPPHKLSSAKLDVTPSFSLSSRALYDHLYEEYLPQRLDIGSNSLTLKINENGVAKVKLKIPESLERFTLTAHFTTELDEDYAQLNAVSSHSLTNKVIHVTTSTEIGEALQYGVFHVYANFYMKYFYYLVVSKGNVLLTGQQSVNGMLQSITTFSIPLSTEMSPTCELIVYHVSQDGEIISDSVSLPVNGINRQKLTLKLNLNQDRSGNLIELIPSLTKSSIIGHSVLDNDYKDVQGFNDITSARIEFALRKFETIKTKKSVLKTVDGIEDKVTHYKTHNNARDTESTFAFNGLILFTNFQVSSLPKVCNQSFYLNQTTIQNQFTTMYRITNNHNQKRSLNPLLRCFSGEQCYEINQRCDGHLDCVDGTDEIDCQEIINQNQILNDFFIYRKNRNNYFYSATEGNFGWKQTFTSYNVDNYVAINVPKRAALWQINAIGVSQERGLAILEQPLYHSSVRPFFITVEVPDTAIIGEQIGLRVAAFNYQPIEIEADITLDDSPDYEFVHVGPMGRVSSYAPKTSRGIHQHLIYLLPYTSKLVPIPIVATKRGIVKIVIIGRCQVAQDKKEIEVEILSDGAEVNLHTSLLLDLRAQAYNIKFLDINVTEDPVIPYEDNVRRYIYGSSKAYVSIIGDVVGTPAQITPLIDFTSLNIKSSAKSGELRMFNFAYRLYTLIYLRLTNQLETSEQQDLGKQFLEELNRDYVHQLVYYNNYSFTMFERESSVWLTAYCAKVYYDAQNEDWHNFIYIDPQIINNAISYVLNHQILDNNYLYGSFYEPYNNWTSPRYTPIALTAHVLITLVRVKITDIHGSIGVIASNARKSAIAFLESQLQNLESPYEVAIATYALMEAGSADAKVGFVKLESMKRITEGMVYWSIQPIKPPSLIYQSQRPYIQPRTPQLYESLAIEGTSYALMVYMRYEGLISDQIVKWLNFMRLHSFGFVSTFDTIIAIQALTDYSFRTHVRSITNMKLAIEGSSNSGLVTVIDLTSDKLAHHNLINIGPNVWGHVTLTAKGAGLAIVQLDTVFNVDHNFLLLQPQLNSFDLKMEFSLSGRNKSKMAIKSCAKWTLTKLSKTSGIAVMELTIPTGYMQNKAVIDKYVESRIVPRLSQAKVKHRSATFIFDYLDSEWSCVHFSVERWFAIANLTRWLKARVYDLYQPELFREKIVDDFSLYALHICEVCGSYQCPYCPYFSYATVSTSAHKTVLLILSLRILFYFRFKC